MKYIWELIAKAKGKGLQPTDLTFLPTKDFSPYLELNFEDLNDDTVPTVAEVNPYYRFLTVFKDYFDPDYHGDVTIRHELFNLICHYLAELDTYMGMTKREYELLFVIHDIEQGLYGHRIRDGFSLFDWLEKKVVAENLLRLYTLGEGIYLFDDTVRKLYKKATIYGNLTDKDVLMVHLLVEESDVHTRRIQCLKNIFLACQYDVDIYWIHLFGIMGIDGAMKQGEMVMY
ncbi:MAG: hypothetical protein FWG67_02000 [Defluviitaleaceae bacterium]|nr:hypothetical protein [Defluviitaleaceae bacterium]